MDTTRMRHSRPSTTGESGQHAGPANDDELAAIARHHVSNLLQAEIRAAAAAGQSDVDHEESESGNEPAPEDMIMFTLEGNVRAKDLLLTAMVFAILAGYLVVFIVDVLSG